MNQEEFTKYKNGRYQEQIDWYDSRAISKKCLYYWFQGLLIFFTVCVPIMIMQRELFGDLISIVLSLAAAALASSLKAFRFQELWMNYRTTCESLKKEEHYYTAEIGPYKHTSDNEGLFVERVESLISRENTLWYREGKSNGDNANG